MSADVLERVASGRIQRQRGIVRRAAAITGADADFILAAAPGIEADGPYLDGAVLAMLTELVERFERGEFCKVSR